MSSTADLLVNLSFCFIAPMLAEALVIIIGFVFGKEDWSNRFMAILTWTIRITALPVLGLMIAAVILKSL
jgi:hypothetical protein